MECKKCTVWHLGVMSGQGFRDYTCPICKQTYPHCNTHVPKVCDKCSEKYHICQECGETIIDNE